MSTKSDGQSHYYDATLFRRSKIHSFTKPTLEEAYVEIERLISVYSDSVSAQVCERDESGHQVMCYNVFPGGKWGVILGEPGEGKGFCTRPRPVIIA